MNALLDYLQAFGDRAKELGTEPQNYLAGLLQSLPDRNSLQGAVKDPEFYKGLLGNTKEMAGGLLTGAVGAPVDIATMMMRPGGYNVPDKQVVGSSNHLAGLLGLDAESTPYKVGSLLPTDPGDAMKYAGLLGQVAWHGSPHKFDKFKLDKIGTGEGAQAYGHGLYFAENPAVAKDYAGALSAARANKPVGNVDLAQAYQSLPNDVPDSLLAARRDFRALNDAGELSRADRRDFLEAVQGNITAAQGGSLYKVDIADDAIPKMLDWDKPLSEQSEGVRRALGVNLRDSDAKVRLAEVARNEAAPSSFETGGEYYRRLAAQPHLLPGFKVGMDSNAVAAAHLRSLGVPGIRYLDGASRGKGGTSNFVVFDDELVKILERK